MTIPQYPHFKNLSIEDGEEIKKITENYEPYSDFNFISLWSYDTTSSIEISILNGNLCVKFTDYLTSEFFYSFIGNNDILNTINELLKFPPHQLKLVPEISISGVNNLQDYFEVSEDTDNNDYILSCSILSELAGNKFRGKRNFVIRFNSLYPSHSFEVLKLESDITRKQILNLFYHWEKKQNKKREETSIELEAINRLLNVSQKLNLVSLGIYYQGDLVAFSINEIIGDYAVIHFEKVNLNYVGAFQILKQKTSHYFMKLGIHYINYEQDLGIEGLRIAKKSWRPVKFLKKYTISPKQV